MESLDITKSLDNDNPLDININSKNEIKPTMSMVMDRDIEKKNIASDNLNNNKVNTNIDPDTVGNNININIYMCSSYVECCIHN